MSRTYIQHSENVYTIIQKKYKIFQRQRFTGQTGDPRRWKYRRVGYLKPPKGRFRGEVSSEEVGVVYVLVVG